MQRTRLPIAISFLLLFAGLFLTTEASAKQCVFNKGGYVLNVRWYHRKDVSIANTGYQDRLGRTQNLGPAAKSAALTAGFGSCNETDEVMVAFLSIPACNIVQLSDGTRTSCADPTYISPKIMVGRHDLNSGVTIVPTSGPLPLDCPAPSGYCKVVSAAESPAASGEIVLITEPSKTQYLDFWGGIADVQWGPGGPIPGCGWTNGHDPSLTSDGGRGITDANAHYQYIAGGASTATAAGFVGNRMTALSSCLPRGNYAKLYAAVSVAIAAVGRARAGWVDSADPKWTSDPGRGISDANAHLQWANATAEPAKGGAFVGSRMTSLGSLPRDVYAKLYSDVSVLIAKCGGTGQCGP